MNLLTRSLRLLLIATVVASPTARAETPTKPPAETKLAGPDGLSVMVRMQGPYDADVPLQVVCYFKRTADSDKKMAGAPVELDKRLGGLIGSLRARGEFAGDDLETLLVDVPEGTIKPKRLLLIGIGDEAALTLDKMERVGRTALREAARVEATRVAFAPLIRDQGNDKLKTGDVEVAVVRGMLLGYDTERRLQKQGFAKAFTLEEWVVEAGPTYYDETVTGVKSAITQAADAVNVRSTRPYSTKSK
ncbi:peptidase m17 : Leucyl aminopeptidase OS=Singulisphaera acidiphila (strain ATCC BAA-1392 / DSM 18658 / VKM B-2454 / MOB10) GN=Sinac_4440 PE=4 SV=1: Peptidase_M17_N [Gemmata massiliana]|uniref:Peptidase M17 leucyl aminopeptidase N-terminal domain-containing protein n=1 Tax=Gemmata massiliana TaxID=1210884 RepID=A0A6P2CXZ9_9BACT|nr:M17 family peptidase N-terminal domain-containing protein [Gemmata massiliana]VTR94008.1 peptidase m17 : Leucyl aminopeptidase OS=Singulisphaera acidiphila (strain ATCC BAA-1392 / DSM 18658 / VKM B-2454 / MOB10) GN=Sinac_4440 PE=4 SV=1: Peptidase_M17_N [Gemmata massiliana]